MLKLKDILLLLLIVGLTASFLFIGKWTAGITVFENLSPLTNHQIVYQGVTLLIAVLLLLILWGVKRTEFRTFFRKGNISAEITPAPWIGIKPKGNQTWLYFGLSIGITISVVTAIIIYFQLLNGKEIDYSNILPILLFSLIFSLINSFAEESVTRISVVVALKGKVSDKAIPLISALIFGTVHYWGNPGGIPGVLAAGFLGWFLAKSILETKGIFWAWLIHFMQDVIIFSARFLAE
ncbi:MAG TPA: CPBP family intramembrane metalloprotease [Salinivirgaceae bacterium]|nr:CPBP family intramembrane metalloprotease [Salinivirgaceae bacterium]